MDETFSLYFHIPFCKHRCAYCDFNTYAGHSDSIPAYIEALCREIDLIGESQPKLQVSTIFFGGGTPSLLTTSQYQKIFNTIHRHFQVISAAEISLEANPGTVKLNYLRELFAIGFNRISYGVQSANPQELRMLERIHTFSQVIEAHQASRQAGFDNLNFDLIYGLPEQSLESWQKTIKLICGMRPEHISAYALTIEPGTPFGHWAKKGLLPIPDADLAADQYEWTMEFLASQGYEQYEISNWSLPGRECNHNLQYWRNLNYLGFGAGAHGYAHSYRYSNVLRIKTYIDRLSNLGTQAIAFPMSTAAVYWHHNTLKDDMQETMMTGLRLTQEGVSKQEFNARYQREFQIEFAKEIEMLLKNGLLEWKGERLRLTFRGRLLGNQVFMQFVG